MKSNNVKSTINRKVEFTTNPLSLTTNHLPLTTNTRRGAAAMIALVLIAVLGAITAVMLKDFHQSHKQRQQAEVRIQAKQLLADFQERTVARLNTDPDAPGEQIVIPPFCPRFYGTFTLSFDSEGVQVEYNDEQGRTIYFEKVSPPDGVNLTKNKRQIDGPVFGK